jgi:pimeloyl-ACP methyl ester carboxylesterase
MTATCRTCLAALLVLCALTARPTTAAAQGLSLEQCLRLGVPLTWLPPPGVPQNPTPVIIVGGTMASEIVYWVLESRLSQAGYVVQFFPLPLNGTQDIALDAVALDRVVDAVRTATGSPKVQMIGHSQGSIAARTYISRYQGETKVETLVSLAGPHQGTEVVSGTFMQYPFPTLFGCYLGNPFPSPSPSPCEQMAVGSALVREVNTRPANDPIYYTNVSTKDDTWIVPYTNAFMPTNCNRTNASGDVLECNILIQKYCPDHPVDHANLPSDDKVWALIQQSLQHRKIDLGCGSMGDAPATVECETSEAKTPTSGTASYPRAVARVPAAKLAQGFVRVGGGCEVSRFGHDSVHAAVLVQSVPDGEDGWACKAADPAFTPNPAWARATVNYCRVLPTATAPSQKLACMTATQKSALGRNPLAAVELSPAQISAGYAVVAGGCDSSYAGNGSIHAENIVRSGRTASNAGWSCQAADPPNNGQDATVTATLVACRVDLSATDKARFTVPPALQCQVTRTPPSGLQSYPQALARAPSLTDKVFGGECLLSYAGHGSVHAEFMVEHGFHGVDTWGCLGADPPLLPNPGTAQAGVITCHVTPGQ